MTEQPILRVENLIKHYGSSQAVRGISFLVPRGKIIGLLGPNGAGKTTTIHMLLGVTTATSGSIHYFGKDFFKHRQESLQRINFTSSFNTLQGRISVEENLIVFAELYQVKESKKKIKELVEYFEVGDLLDQRFWDLSSGQKTRVNLIKSLLNDPELILMDEPTASLDPDIADKTIVLIEKLNKEQGTSILYTSHDMAEVTRVCEQVIFLDHGKIVAQDSPIGLTKRIRTAQLKLAFGGNREVLVRHLEDRKLKYDFPTPFLSVIDTEEKEIPELIAQVSRLDIDITDIEIRKPTLEDVFLRIARGADEGGKNVD